MLLSQFTTTLCENSLNHELFLNIISFNSYRLKLLNMCVLSER